MLLYRPVGLKELELIAQSGWRAFPRRLSWQPIFYPVLTHDYARRICADWNIKESESGHAGFVTRFEIDDAVAAKYPVQEVGGRACSELWVPAEELDAFNAAIVGRIEVIESLYGNEFAGEIDPTTKLPRSVSRA